MKEITGILMFVEECMIGTGTLINSAAIVAGGALGHFTGRLFRHQCDVYCHCRGNAGYDAY